jgi:hypothetical protein
MIQFDAGPSMKNTPTAGSLTAAETVHGSCRRKANGLGPMVLLLTTVHAACTADSNRSA